MCPLGFLVLELAEVHQAAHRRLGHRGNLYQIDTGFFGQIERCTQRDDSELFRFQADETNLGGGDFVVDALRLILGDGSILQINNKTGRCALY